MPWSQSGVFSNWVLPSSFGGQARLIATSCIVWGASKASVTCWFILHREVPTPGSKILILVAHVVLGQYCSLMERNSVQTPHKHIYRLTD